MKNNYLNMWARQIENCHDKWCENLHKTQQIFHANDLSPIILSINTTIRNASMSKTILLFPGILITDLSSAIIALG